MPSYGNDLVLVPAGTVVTATGVGSGFQVVNKAELRAVAAVTAISGTTPSITVNIQTSHDDGAADAYRTIASFPAQTTVSSSAWQSFAGLDRYVRATWTVSGTTPSVTFGVSGEAV